MALAVTALIPAAANLFAGKIIEPDGRVLSEPRIKWWHHQRHEFASLGKLHAYLESAQRNNVCLIRGATASTDTRVLRRLQKETEPNGFADVPTAVMTFDVDDAPAPGWTNDPTGAVDAIVGQLGAPFVGASYAACFTGSHGLVRDTNGHWTGEVGGDRLRARIYFHLDRDITSLEAEGWTQHLRQRVPQLDPAISRCVQINYIARPRFLGRPRGFDPLIAQGLPTCWLRPGAHDLVEVPDDLPRKVAWAKAEARGESGPVANHPSAVVAVRAIGKPLVESGGKGAVYPHLQCAAHHLLRANPPAGGDGESHARLIRDAIAALVKEHAAKIKENLAGRPWADVERYVADMVRYVIWLLAHRTDDDKVSTKGVRREHVSGGAASPDSDLTAARKQLEQAINNRTPLPGAWSLRATLGLGKSRAMRHGAAQLLRSADGSIVIATPRHALSEEQIKAFYREHPDSPYVARVWRGRGADDPERPGEKMCPRHEEAEAVAVAGGSAEQLCKRKKEFCPLYDICGHQRQRQKANLWFVAHESLVHRKPEAIGEVKYVFVDETPLDAFTFGVTGHPYELALDALTEDAKKSKGLGYVRQQLYDILTRLSPGPVPTKVLEKFDTERCRELARLEWKEKLKVDVRPSISATTDPGIAAATAHNAIVARRAALWRLIGKSQQPGAGNYCGFLEIVASNGNGRMIRMRGTREVASGWQAGTLIADATADAKMLRAVWPELKPATDDVIVAPPPDCVRIEQCVDVSFAKGKLDDRRIRKAYAAALGFMLARGGAALLITHKATEQFITEHLFVPTWLELAHFGDLTGVDRWKAIRTLVVIGRPLPPEAEVIRQAGALFGTVTWQQGYELTNAFIPVVPDEQGRNAVRVRQHRHRDANVERCRWQVTEAALLQAIGRGRPILRTAETPLDILLLTDVPLPELGAVYPRLWAELAPGPDETMLAAGGVWLENASDAAAAYPNLFRSADAVWQGRTRKGRREVPDISLSRILLEREMSGTSPSKPHLNTLDPTLAQRLAHLVAHLVSYRRPGPGHRTTPAVFLEGAPSDPVVWLCDRLGPVELVDPPAATAQPAGASPGFVPEGREERSEGDRGLAATLKLAREIAGEDGIVGLLLEDQIFIVPPPLAA
jgi:hypothetical protein